MLINISTSLNESKKLVRDIMLFMLILGQDKKVTFFSYFQSIFSYISALIGPRGALSLQEPTTSLSTHNGPIFLLKNMKLK